jgi:hypothetical protein
LLKQPAARFVFLPGYPSFMTARRLIAVGSGIFFGGVAISAAAYFCGRPIHFTDEVISNFLSPIDNPRGYRAAALGTAIAGLTLAPTALTFYRRMRGIHRWGAMAGTVFYAAGLLAAIAIGCLSPVRELDFSVHLALAYAAFMSIQAGILAYLTVAAYGSKSRRLTLFATVEWVLAVLLFAASFGPEWPGSTALCEWGLSATIAAGLWVLASWCS